MKPDAARSTDGSLAPARRHAQAEPPSTCALAAASQTTVYFDGSCPLCQREIALAKMLTGEVAVAYCDISALAPAQHVSQGLTAAEAMARFHVRRGDGKLINGAAAFLEMWSLSPRLRFLKRLSSSRAAISGLDAVYAGFLKIRPSLSRALRRYDAWRSGLR